MVGTEGTLSYEVFGRTTLILWLTVSNGKLERERVINTWCSRDAQICLLLRVLNRWELVWCTCLFLAKGPRLRRGASNPTLCERRS